MVHPACIIFCQIILCSWQNSLTSCEATADLVRSVVQQYWDTSRGAYKYIPVKAFAEAFQQTQTAHENMQALEQPYVAPNPKCDEALFTHKYALPCE